jgi:hypothetical protein
MFLSFDVPSYPGYVDHKEFCKILNEAFYQTDLERQPGKKPIQHVVTHDNSLNFLNFEERFAVSHALQKLSRFPDEVSNLTMFFDDYDGKSGDVSRTNYERALTTAGLFELLTTFELNVLFKCFSIERGTGNVRFDYRTFSTVISEIYKM